MCVETVDALCDPAAQRFVLRATVYPSPDSSGSVGYGAPILPTSPPWCGGAGLRMAETRAVNRALRKAYGIDFMTTSAPTAEYIGWAMFGRRDGTVA